MGIIGIMGIMGIMGVAGAAKLCHSGIPCNPSHPKKHHTNLRAAVRKDRGSGGKKIVEERNNCHPTGAEPAAKNLVIFPQKSGKITNLFDAKFPTAPTGVPSDILRTRPRRASGVQGGGRKAPCKKNYRMTA